MTHLRVQSTPPSLYVRGIKLGVLPLVQELRPNDLLVRLSRDGPRVYDHAKALLAAAELTAHQRKTLEASELAYARYASSHPLQGAWAYARIVPLLAPERQVAVRTEARAVLERAGSLLVATRPEGGSWLMLYRDNCTLLPYRELWRVLAPEEYPAWLRHHCNRMLQPHFWWTPPRLYRENLAQIHLLGPATPDCLALALEGVTEVHDGFVTADRELGMGGAPAFSAADEEAANNAARRVALHTLAPILPPELHPRAAALAAELGIAVPADLGVQLADPLAARGLAWHHATPDQPVPWLTVAERERAFAELDDVVRAAHVAALVEAALSLADTYQLNRTQGHLLDRGLDDRWARLTAEDLPVAAPYLTEAQTRRLLTLWGLPQARDSTSPHD